MALTNVSCEHLSMTFRERLSFCNYPESGTIGYQPSLSYCHVGLPTLVPHLPYPPKLVSCVCCPQKKVDDDTTKTPGDKEVLRVAIKLSSGQTDLNQDDPLNFFSLISKALDPPRDRKKKKNTKTLNTSLSTLPE